jgi:hypothetical protein
MIQSKKTTYWCYTGQDRKGVYSRLEGHASDEGVVHVADATPRNKEDSPTDEKCQLIFHPLGPFIRWQGFSEEMQEFPKEARCQRNG